MSRRWTPSDWMSQLSDSARQLPLCQLALPGSHDSCTEFLDLAMPLGPDALDAPRRYFDHWPGRLLLRRWWRTQSLTVRQQLDAGVRYLDLRVALVDGCFRLLHSLMSVSLEEVLEQISDFLNAHPKEAVLLDFNHLYSMDSQSDLLSFQQLVVSKLGSRLHRPASSNTLPSLSQLHAAGQSVLAFQLSHYDRQTLPAFWENRWIPSPWPNTTDIGKMVAALDQTYTIEHANNFLVLQAVLTPTAAYLCKHPLGTLHQSLALPGNAAFVDWLKDSKKSLGSHGVNIALTDFVEANGFLEAVIGMNFPYNEEQV